MVKFYAMRIIDGKSTLSKVPERLKQAVIQELIKRGYENLTMEEKIN